MVTLYNDTLMASSNVNLDSLTDFEFVQPSFANVQSIVKSQFGFVRTNSSNSTNNRLNSSDSGSGHKQQPPISRPISSSGSASNLANNVLGLSSLTSNSLAAGILAAGTNGHANSGSGGTQLNTYNSVGGHSMLERHRSQPSSYSLSSLHSLGSNEDPGGGGSGGLLLSKRFNRPLGPLVGDMGLSGVPVTGGNGVGHNPYEKWSNGTDSSTKQLMFNSGSANDSNDHGQQSQQSMLDLSSKLIPQNGPIFPPKSQIKRQKMIYHCKFGEFGVLEGQFTEPSGVAVNAQNDIIVADTNNHRIQIFDKEGRFKFQFGECGKRDGQLLYPNRVAVVRQSGDIIVTERSPTHQVQIYNQYGQFVRKFGANILQVNLTQIFFGVIDPKHKHPILLHWGRTWWVTKFARLRHLFYLDCDIVFSASSWSLRGPQGTHYRR